MLQGIVRRSRRSIAAIELMGSVLWHESAGQRESSRDCRTHTETGAGGLRWLDAHRTQELPGAARALLS